jgi:peptidoglycan-N-acetylmuramic acid deacetylase
MKKILIPVLLLLMLAVNIAKMNYENSTLTSGDIPGGGKVTGWGLSKREAGVAPAPDPGAPELLKQYDGIYIGDTEKNKIYLTFDQGYENGYTPKILDVLQLNNVKSVFFITGHYLKENRELVKRMLEEGHEIGNHGMLHKSLPTLSEEGIKKEVKDLDDAFFQEFGKRMRFIRPPKGEYSERSLRVTQEMGYINVFWSFAYQDWLQDKIRGEDYAFNEVSKYFHNGEIILLHAVSPDNAYALDRIIKNAREKGYEFGILEELVK